MGLFRQRKATRTYVQESPERPAAPVQPPTPVFQNPEDLERWEIVHSAHSLVAAMMSKYQECFEKADLAHKAFAIGDAEFVDVFVNMRSRGRTFTPWVFGWRASSTNCWWTYGPRRLQHLSSGVSSSSCFPLLTTIRA
jgi:hypothetical protein